MKILNRIAKKLKTIRKYLKNSQYEQIDSIYSQNKYAKLFQKVIQLDGDQVQVAVDSLMNEVIAYAKEEFATLFSSKDISDQSLLDGFQKILRDQLVQIYWISIIFNQFDSFVFLGFHQMTIQQYCLKKILEGSFGKYSKKIVKEIIEALYRRKKATDQNEKFNPNLLQIINFFSYRTFLNLLSIEKLSSDYEMDVTFNCEFTEKIATRQIKEYEKRKKEEEMFKLTSSEEGGQEDEDSDNDSDHEEEEEEQKRDNINKQDKMIDESEKDNQNQMEIEKPNNDQIKAVKKIKADKHQLYESLFSMIEKMYTDRLSKESKEFISSIKDEKVSKQIKQIEEFIYREEHFVSYYIGRISVKVADILNNICILQNYPNLVNHPKYGLSYLFDKKEGSKLKALFNLPQNDEASIKVLATTYNKILEQKLSEIDQEQSQRFKSYKEKQRGHNGNKMESQEDQESQKQHLIEYLQQCQEKWITQIFELFQEAYTNGLEKAFDSHPVISSALSRAFENDFNMNEYIVDYLANVYHIHLLHEKYRNANSQKIQDFIKDKPENTLFKLFSFTTQKDQFLEIYRQKLSRRLIYKMTDDEQKENKFIQNLENIIGSTTQINNMKIMIKDLQNNVLLQMDYQPIPEKTDSKQSEDQNRLTKKSSQAEKEKKKERRNRSRSRSRSYEKNKKSNNNDDDEIEVRSRSNSSQKRHHKDNKSNNTKAHNDDSDSAGFIEINEDAKDDEDMMILEDTTKRNKRLSKKNKKKITSDDGMINDDEEEKKTEIEAQKDIEQFSGKVLNLSILTYIKWPLKQSKVSVSAKLPDFLDKQYHEYTGKYLSEFQHQRKLELLHHSSYSTISFKSDSKELFGGVYTLQVSSYSMIILLCFNNYSTLKFQEIHSQTSIKKKTLQEKLDILVKFKILIQSTGSSMDIEDNKKSQTYKVNTKFTNKRSELEIDWVEPDQSYSPKLLEGLRGDTNDNNNNSKEISEDVINHRKIVVNCKIVKIMKEKEKLHQDELISEVQDRLKSSKQLFVPANNFVKDQIAHCIKNSFIKFSEKEEEKDIIIYLK